MEDICPILAVAAVVGGHMYNEFGGQEVAVVLAVVVVLVVVGVCA